MPRAKRAEIEGQRIKEAPEKTEVPSGIPGLGSCRIKTQPSVATDSNQNGSAPEANSLRWKENRSFVRWRSTHCDQSHTGPRGNHCSEISVSLDDRNLFALLQAYARLSLFCLATHKEI